MTDERKEAPAHWSAHEASINKPTEFETTGSKMTSHNVTADDLPTQPWWATSMQPAALPGDEIEMLATTDESNLDGDASVRVEQPLYRLADGSTMADMMSIRLRGGELAGTGASIIDISSSEAALVLAGDLAGAAGLVDLIEARAEGRAGADGAPAWSTRTTEAPDGTTLYVSDSVGEGRTKAWLDGIRFPNAKTEVSFCIATRGGDVEVHTTAEARALGLGLLKLAAQREAAENEGVQR
ncbi:hypothetical protein [Pseudoclavibacter sp. CFCC 13611]|uniref:hypothetical protein n=1 Tax=Pseudoclavibacter sp. CFCC 13611 TaxID=2615178 RepID=UPI0013016E0B|nr:hypothetical protein [Pseudoclavibacter sp. CFCC 13611]KAB1662757.1 hypothetical protein F8O08_09300 [Pseudoclavibacter sp. CFCC 13611]